MKKLFGFNMTRIALLVIMVFFHLSCSHNNSSMDVSKTSNLNSHSETIFQSLPSEKTGLKFVNSIQEHDDLNFFTYEYLYNGGGVSAGDLNNDGLTDLFFTGNMSPNKTFLNRGNLKFDDVTSVINLNKGKDWSTGSTMVDINQDGNLDIYVCRSGWFKDASKRKNLLWINNGDGTFSEEGEKFGIADSGYSVHASFFDYDKDGDLDLFVTNHPNEFSEELSTFKAKHKNPPSDCRDKLYKNEGGFFKDVSDQVGIKTYGHSLGLITSDLNNDGWIDIYVSNDYQEPDYFFKNNGDGTFSDIAEAAMKHTAKFSMGVDANDINNDGLVDIFTVEMLAEDLKRQKTNMAPMGAKLYWRFVNEGFGHQYMHNCLQINNGNETFSETAYLSNVAMTDWSWAPLIADFDNDGFKDIFVSNGYKRDLLNKDFQKKKKALLTKSDGAKFSELEKLIPSTKIPNYIFQNQGGITFEDKSKDWGIGIPSFSNGATYADLDNDGDLEIIVNNINQDAFLYENNSKNNNYLKVKLAGYPSNQQAIGSKISIRCGSDIQFNEVLRSRGFQSTVESISHFGLGQHTVADELTITWPNGKSQTLKNVEANQLLTVNFSEAKLENRIANSSDPIFNSLGKETGITFQHREKEFDDYASQVLLPHKSSQNGGTVLTGDVNGDGLDDLIFGAAADYPTELYLQNGFGDFSRKEVSAFQADRVHEDMGGLLFDADNDGDLDLYFVSGSSEFEIGSAKYIDRLYKNDGQGGFEKSVQSIPQNVTSGSCVQGADFDNDGDIDLFVGGRIIPGKYPFSPTSYILENNGGTFKDVTKNIAPNLEKVGMVTSAVWTDVDNDEDLDLIIAGEWMPISVFVNSNGQFENKTKSFGLDKTNGWWNSIAGADFDQDGDIDYVLGNLGTNSKHSASKEEPFVIYANDFDGNGKNDIVLAKSEDDQLYPARGLQCSAEQLPTIKSKMTSYQIFAESTVEQVYGSDKLNDALNYEAYEFRSALLLNEGGKSFSFSPLPDEVQVAPTNGIVINDYNQDGCLDIILVGNQYPVEVETGRYDAHKGIFLSGSCTSKFEVMPFANSGFFVDGDAKSIAPLTLAGKNKLGLIVGLNNDHPILFESQIDALDSRIGSTQNLEASLEKTNKINKYK